MPIFCDSTVSTRLREPYDKAVEGNPYDAGKPIQGKDADFFRIRYDQIDRDLRSQQQLVQVDLDKFGIQLGAIKGCRGDVCSFYNFERYFLKSPDKTVRVWHTVNLLNKVVPPDMLHPTWKEILTGTQGLSFAHMVPHCEQWITGLALWLRENGVISSDPVAAEKWKASHFNIAPITSLLAKTMEVQIGGLLLLGTKKCMYRLCLVSLLRLYDMASEADEEDLAPFSSSDFKVSSLLAGWAVRLRPGTIGRISGYKAYLFGKHYLDEFGEDYKTDELLVKLDTKQGEDGGRCKLYESHFIVTKWDDIAPKWDRYQLPRQVCFWNANGEVESSYVPIQWRAPKKHKQRRLPLETTMKSGPEGAIEDLGVGPKVLVPHDPFSSTLIFWASARRLFYDHSEGFTQMSQEFKEIMQLSDFLLKISEISSLCEIWDVVKNAPPCFKDKYNFPSMSTDPPTLKEPQANTRRGQRDPEKEQMLEDEIWALRFASYYHEGVNYYLRRTAGQKYGDYIAKQPKSCSMELNKKREKKGKAIKPTWSQVSSLHNPKTVPSAPLNTGKGQAKAKARTSGKIGTGNDSGNSSGEDCKQGYSEPGSQCTSHLALDPALEGDLIQLDPPEQDLVELIREREGIDKDDSMSYFDESPSDRFARPEAVFKSKPHVSKELTLGLLKNRIAELYLEKQFKFNVWVKKYGFRKALGLQRRLRIGPADKEMHRLFQQVRDIMVEDTRCHQTCFDVLKGVKRVTGNELADPGREHVFTADEEEAEEKSDTVSSGTSSPKVMFGADNMTTIINRKLEAEERMAREAALARKRELDELKSRWLLPARAHTRDSPEMTVQHIFSEAAKKIQEAMKIDQEQNPPTWDYQSVPMEAWFENSDFCRILVNLRDRRAHVHDAIATWKQKVDASGSLVNPFDWFVEKPVFVTPGEEESDEEYELERWEEGYQQD